MRKAVLGLVLVAPAVGIPIFGIYESVGQSWLRTVLVLAVVLALVVSVVLGIGFLMDAYDEHRAKQRRRSGNRGR